MPQKAPSKLVSKPNRWGYDTGPSNEVEEELRDLYIKKLQAKRNPVNFADEPLKDMPEVASPPMFQQPIRTPAPLKTGDTEEPPWDYIQRVVPEMKGTSPSIQFGPTAAVLNSMSRSGFEDPSSYNRLNLLGARTVENAQLGTPGEISLNPGLGVKSGYNTSNTNDLDRVTAHEMAHGAYVDEGREMGNIEGLMLMAREAQRMKEGRPSIKPMGYYNPSQANTESAINELVKRLSKLPKTKVKVQR